MTGTIFILIIISIFCLAAVGGIAYYDHKNNTVILTSESTGKDWLFNGFQDLVYDAFFKNENSDSICGVSKKEYERYCKITHTTGKFKTIVAFRIEAAIILFAGTLIAYSVMSMVWAAVSIICIAAVTAIAMWMLPYNNLKNKAEERLYQIQNDLPRFLSLMEKAMDLPIDQALLITAQKFPSPLSDDVIDSINKVSLGADGWQSTLFELAKAYEITDFSDLVLEIVNSYEQGVNVRKTVERKVYEIEQNRLYAVEAHDAKIKTMIFLPVILLKILPLMVLIVLPMIAFYM